MEQIVNRVSLEKYLDTDIDELVIKFIPCPHNLALYGEFDLPPNVKSIISYEEYDDSKRFAWIAVANPLALQEALMDGEVKLPKVEFQFEDTTQTLESFLININLNDYEKSTF